MVADRGGLFRRLAVNGAEDGLASSDRLCFRHAKASSSLRGKTASRTAGSGASVPGGRGAAEGVAPKTLLGRPRAGGGGGSRRSAAVVIPPGGTPAEVSGRGGTPLAGSSSAAAADSASLPPGLGRDHHHRELHLGVEGMVTPRVLSAIGLGLVALALVGMMHGFGG